jgi:hypothetical protein
MGAICLPSTEVLFSLLQKTLSVSPSCNQRMNCRALKNFLGKSRIQCPVSFTMEAVETGNSHFLVQRDVGNSCHINITGAGVQEKCPFINITAQLDTLLGV